MSESFPTEIHNHDIVWLYDQVSRFYVEVSKAQSSPVSGMITADQLRLASYLTNLKKGINWVNSMPEMDLPESHPFPRDLEPFPADVNVENESSNMVLRMLRLLAIELTNSQSSRLSSRLIKHDLVRVVTIVTKIESFLNDYIKDDATVPLDYPESAPEDPMTTDGNMG